MQHLPLRLRRAFVVAVAFVLATALGCNRRLAVSFQPVDAEAPPPSAPPPDPEPETQLQPQAQAQAQAQPQPPPKPAATCAGYCEHALRCANAFTPAENASCLSSCEAQHPTTARLAEMNAMSCQQIIAAMLGGGAKPSSAPAPKPAAACTDCVGCYWEQDMCLYVHGYVATGIKQACKRCCCPGH